mmetsp:Transcript_39521/g.95576  ORF Transcript_39521/g.95576 Transcript_39521/m.95576 type:complete len:112 (-) Transcript_39521:478-813(-)
MQPAQQELKIKSTKIQQMANMLKLWVPKVIVVNNPIKAATAICKERIPPSASMTGPNSTLPMATAMVDRPNNLAMDLCGEELEAVKDRPLSLEVSKDKTAGRAHLAPMTAK